MSTFNPLRRVGYSGPTDAKPVRRSDRTHARAPTEPFDGLSGEVDGLHDLDTVDSTHGLWRAARPGGSIEAYDDTLPRLPTDRLEPASIPYAM